MSCVSFVIQRLYYYLFNNMNSNTQENEVICDPEDTVGCFVVGTRVVVGLPIVGNVLGDAVGAFVVGAPVEVGDDVGPEVNSKLSYTVTAPALLIPLVVIDPGDPTTSVFPPYIHKDHPNILW